MTPNTLAIAVASGRIGYVYLTDGEVKDWGISVVGSRSPEAARAKVEHLFRVYHPNLIITEKLSPHTRKSDRTIRNIRIIEDAAVNSDAHHIAVEHVQYHANKYQEIDALAKKHPALEPLKVKPRRLWESENRNCSIWEALALYDQAEL